MSQVVRHTYYEFFAGGALGLVNEFELILSLSQGWDRWLHDGDCVNDSFLLKYGVFK